MDERFPGKDCAVVNDKSDLHILSERWCCESIPQMFLPEMARFISHHGTESTGNIYVKKTLTYVHFFVYGCFVDYMLTSMTAVVQEHQFLLSIAGAGQLKVTEKMHKYQYKCRNRL